MLHRIPPYLIVNKYQVVEKFNLSDDSYKTRIKRLGDIFQEEKLREENEDAYSEIRLQMHNHLIKKLRSLKDDWKLENTSQLVERIFLAFFRNEI